MPRAPVTPHPCSPSYIHLTVLTPWPRYHIGSVDYGEDESIEEGDCGNGGVVMGCPGGDVGYVRLQGRNVEHVPGGNRKDTIVLGEIRKV